MTQDSSSSTIAGWYGDPSDASRLRWWDGSAWTTETRRHPPAAAPRAIVAESAEAATTGVRAAETPALTRRELRAREAAAQDAASVPPTVGDAASAARIPAPVPVPVPAPVARQSAPSTAAATATTALLDRGAVTSAFRDETGFVRVATPTAPVSIFTPRRPTRVHTFSVWLLALLPLPWAAGVHALTRMMPADEVWTMRASAVGVFVVLSLVCAFRDGRVLRAGRHSETASPGWVLLTPLVFLVVRTVKVNLETGMRGSGPVLVWLTSMTGAVAIIGGGALSRLAFA